MNPSTRSARAHHSAQRAAHHAAAAYESAAPSAAAATSRTPKEKTAAAPTLGQIIEYIPDRLYLASYTSPPTEDTLFPYPEPPATMSPTKRGVRSAHNQRKKPLLQPPFYFTVDDMLLYNAFHHDFGPLHIGHLYRFALMFHEILSEVGSRPIVFWSAADPRSRANASCLLACYMVMIQSWPPHLALAPISQIDPPLMPFRDAGYSQADYGLTVQDVVYGVWKAKEEKCCVVDNFDLDEYEKYERVESGDFNWINPNFLAFASPMHQPIERISAESELFTQLPRTLEAVDAHPTLPTPFKEVLKHFKERNIGLVVRLNSQLYSPSYFEALGIQHLDMIFEDGTCPPLSTVRKFIRLAREMIDVRKKGIAVHCKAGLGRTGCLIGAYLIYRHGFTANECISYMRFMRPGMVVGPQQHWLHLNQGVFREWWLEERFERRMRRAAAAQAATTANPSTSTGTSTSTSTHVNAGAQQPIPSTPVRAMQRANIRASSKTYTPPQPVGQRSASGRTPLSEMDQDHGRDNTIGVQDDFLPAPTPGQPRKTARMDRRHHSHNHYGRQSSAQPTAGVPQDPAAMTTSETTVEAISVRRASQDVADEEWILRMRSQRKASAPLHASPERKDRTTSASQAAAASTAVTTTTTTTTVYQVMDSDPSHDIENFGATAKSLSKSSSSEREHSHRTSPASGVLTKVRKTRAATAAAAAGGTVREAGVRKTSGRVGSVGAGVGARRLSNGH